MRHRWPNSMMTSSNGNIFRVIGHLCGVNGAFPAQRPVTRSFDVFFDLRLNKRLSKQSLGWWFETPSCPLWRHSNARTFTCFIKGLNRNIYMVYLTSTELYNASACIDSLSIWRREHSEKPASAFCESQWSEQDIGPEWREGTLRMKWQFCCGNISTGC